MHLVSSRDHGEKGGMDTPQSRAQEGAEDVQRRGRSTGPRRVSICDGAGSDRERRREKHTGEEPQDGEGGKVGGKAAT